MNYHNGKYAFVLKGNKLFDKHIFFDRLSNTEQIVDVYLNGNIIKDEMEAVWKYQINGKQDTLIDVNGRISLKDDLFNFVMNRSYEYDAEGKITNRLTITTTYDGAEGLLDYIKGMWATWEETGYASPKEFADRLLTEPTYGEIENQNVDRTDYDYYEIGEAGITSKEDPLYGKIKSRINVQDPVVDQDQGLPVPD